MERERPTKSKNKTMTKKFEKKNCMQNHPPPPASPLPSLKSSTVVYGYNHYTQCQDNQRTHQLNNSLAITNINVVFVVSVIPKTKNTLPTTHHKQQQEKTKAMSRCTSYVHQLIVNIKNKVWHLTSWPRRLSVTRTTKMKTTF